MKLSTQIHAPDEAKEVVERLFQENLDKKIASYLNKFDKEDVEGNIDLNIEKNKKGLFNGKLKIKVDGKSFIYEREDYKNLDDLINHLFDHFKEELSNK